MADDDPFAEMKLILRDPIIWLTATFGVVLMSVGHIWIGAAFIAIFTALYIAYHDRY